MSVVPSNIYLGVQVCDLYILLKKVVLYANVKMIAFFAVLANILHCVIHTKRYTCAKICIPLDSVVFM